MKKSKRAPATALPPPKTRRRPRFREERDPPILPPRKKAWVPGHCQLGLFVRTETGAVLEASWSMTPPKSVTLFGLLLASLTCTHDLSDAFMAEVAKEAARIGGKPETAKEHDVLAALRDPPKTDPSRSPSPSV